MKWNMPGETLQDVEKKEIINQISDSSYFKFYKIFINGKPDIFIWNLKK